MSRTMRSCEVVSIYTARSLTPPHAFSLRLAAGRNMLTAPPTQGANPCQSLPTCRPASCLTSRWASRLPARQDVLRRGADYAANWGRDGAGAAVAYGRAFPEFWVGLPHDGGKAVVGKARTSGFWPRRARRWMPFMRRRWRWAATLMARRACVRCMGRSITVRLCVTWMVTKSRRCFGMRRPVDAPLGCLHGEDCATSAGRAVKDVYCF